MIKEFIKNKSKIIVIWAKYDDAHTYFTDDIPTSADAIASVHCFESVESFSMYWRAIRNCPEDMWYWVLVEENGCQTCICSGACDSGDEDVFVECFGTEYFEET